MKKFICLIDGDILAYRSAAVCQETWWIGIDDKGGVTEFKGKKVYNSLKDELETQEYLKVAPEHAPLGTIKRTLNKIKENCECLEARIFLSPSTQSTFRYNVAKTVEYKGNRKDVVRPYYLKSCRDYLIKYHGAQVCEGVEADDMLGIQQISDMYDTHTGTWKNQGSCNTVICSVDKDLRMIPGWHYNWVTGEQEFISPIGYTKLKGNKLTGGGLKWFYTQLLLGDATDNIIGPPRVGAVTAYRTLEDCKTVEDMENKVFQVYKKAYGDEAMDRLIENGRLLWILNTMSQSVDLWKPEYL